ncbi:MAG: SRPBCC family protein [Bacteroidia bacterium]|nr:SRPBCC family protein [Bacteroidia bacterium]
MSATIGQTEQASNKNFWHSTSTTASEADIWQIWMDVPNWKAWDTGLQDAEMGGKMTLGSKGKITTLEGRKVKFVVVEYAEGKSYTYKTSLPLGGLYVKRSLEQKDGKTYFTHRVWFKGLTAGIFAKQFGPKFREMLPGVLETIKSIAEQENKNK